MNTSIEEKKADAAGTDVVMQMVGFAIGREQFGVDILKVREIIRDAAITAVPNSPGFVEGVINLPGAEHETGKIWILILEIEGRVTGFRVDSVTEVLKIPVRAIEPPPEIVMAGLDSQFIHGVCDISGQLLILLDFSQILHVDEIKRLKAMGS